MTKTTSGRATPEDWLPYLEAIQADATLYEFDWREAALERLLWLTARHGNGGAWAKEAEAREEQRERWALHSWALDALGV
jgi:hypothetical protein